jgi:Cu-processing system permease protein
MSQAILSLTNIVLYLVPLIAVMFSIIYYYNASEFIQLLLSQPVSRRSLFAGIFSGIAGSLSLSLILGIGIPFVIYGLFVSPHIWDFTILLISGLLLTISFSGMSIFMALLFKNRIAGFGFSILVWLFFAIIYDGLFLLLLSIYSDYPLESFALIMSILNPIDLARIAVILKLEISSMMGFTGAVFRKFLGDQSGMLMAIGIMLVWSVLPVLGLIKIAKRRDF